MTDIELVVVDIKQLDHVLIFGIVFCFFVFVHLWVCLKFLNMHLFFLSAMMSQQQLLSQDLYTPSTIQPKTSSVAFTSSPAIAMTAAYTRAAYPTIDFASASGVTSTSSPSLTNIAFSLLQHERSVASSFLILYCFLLN